MDVFISWVVATVAAVHQLGWVAGIGVGAGLYVLMPYKR
jgi:hypothetical protein